MSYYLFGLDRPQGSKSFYVRSMLVNSNQYRGRVGVFNDLSFILVRDENRSLGRSSPNFFVIFIGLFLVKCFVTLILLTTSFAFFSYHYTSGSVIAL